MDDQIIIGAYHEAGHAIAAYFSGWSVHSIELKIENNLLLHGRTVYNYGDSEEINSETLRFRVLTLLGGPVSQNLFENNPNINLDKLGPDGILLDDLLSSFSSDDKSKFIEDQLNILVSIFKSKPFKPVIEKLANRLLNENLIKEPEFLEIVDELKLLRLI